MISMSELNPRQDVLTSAQEANLIVLLSRINQIRTAWAKPMTVTSGFRSPEDQRRIYKEIAQRKGLTTIRIPMGSRHLEGSAVDIADPDGSLMEWTKNNVSLLEQVGLWIEADTKGWVHYQSKPPSSGNRFFKP